MLDLEYYFTRPSLSVIGLQAWRSLGSNFLSRYSLWRRPVIEHPLSFVYRYWPPRITTPHAVTVVIKRRRIGRYATVLQKIKIHPFDSIGAQPLIDLQ